MERHAVAKVQKIPTSNHPHRQSVRSTYTGHTLLELQRAVGNQAIRRLTSSPFIQAKLQVSTPEDPSEQEADRVADSVMRMTEPQAQPSEEEKEETIATKPAVPLAVREDDEEEKIQRLCTECEEEKQDQGQSGGMVHRKSAPDQLLDDDDEEEQRVQSSGTQAATPKVTTSVAANIHAMNGSGRPLSDTTRAFFEPRFGTDFSHVRVHTDSRAVSTANSIQARAFTVGTNIAFGAGQYAPDSDGGRQLLAHELTHVVQQNSNQVQSAQPRAMRQAPQIANSTRPMVQRDIGFEFQVRDNTLTTNKAQKFGVKSGKFFHRLPPGDKNGLELQTDTGGVLEFQTHHFRKWSELQTQIKDAVDVVNSIKKDPKAFPFNQESRLLKEGLLKKGEKLEVDVKDATFLADVQSTEGVALHQYGSLLKEHERDPTKYVDPVLKNAKDIVDAAAKASKTVKAGVNLDNLRGFLQMIINYVRRGQGELWDKTDAEPVKATVRLMARTDFSSTFRDLLTPDEQTLFKDIVNSGAIQAAVGIATNDPFFKTGYWGHVGNMYAFFEGGKVTALAPEDKTPIHDCSKKTKTKGIDSSKCGKKFPDSEITVGGWLDSIVNQKKDKLSPPAHGSGSMGKFPVATKGPEKGLVVIEARGYKTSRPRSQPASKWVDFADDIFAEAAACRPRPGTGTELDYDGTKPFDPKKCP